MSKNDWKYATLTQEERIDRIRSGDTDVYNTEKARLNSYMKSQTEAGLDTSDTKKMLNEVKNARAQAKLNIPKYISNPSLDAAMTNVERAKRKASEAFSQTSKLLSSIEEDYANRGIKTGTNSYKSKRGKLKQELLDALESIEQTYNMRFSDKYRQRAQMMFE